MKRRAERKFRTDNVIDFKPLKKTADLIKCNICEKFFKRSSRYDLFCKTCKRESDLYHFYEVQPPRSI